MRLAIAVSLVLTLMAAATAGAADAKSSKRSKAKTPSVSKVSPMRVGVGRSLSLRGKRFSRSRRSNTVIFISPGKRSAFARVSRASSTKLVVKVPDSLRRLMPTSNGLPVPTRFTIRVISKKRNSKNTTKRTSPIITAKGTVISCKAVDCDGDGLANSREAQLGTDPYLKDTDGDGAEDGFEVESAIDLNQRAVPYPGARPYPNALFPDGGSDYDGDGLSNAEEGAAWAHPAQGAYAGGLQAYVGAPVAPAFSGPYGGQAAYGNHSFPLNYSDGDQDTMRIRAGSSEYRSYLDTDQDGKLTDEERDADGDGLGNGDEIRGLMQPGYYSPLGNCTDVATGNDYSYKPLLPREMASVNWLASDTDGDGVLDGNDDQDNDDVSNVDEILPPYQDCSEDNDGVIVRGPVGDTGLRSPYNPCLPYRSRSCGRYTGKG